MEPTLKEIEEIYHVALEKGSGQAREAYLSRVCRENPALRAHVEALLRANEQAGDFLEAPALGPDTMPAEPPVAEGPGSTIGRYKLLEKIGEGGMAVVYMAEQTEPIRRKVALKIIKLGMDTRQVIARFEAERQALALMDHPSIAKVLDAGATETGRPYFVMELVQGVSITEYCDKNNLSTKDRLALFLQVCNAVQHAHQKGIIHRDIKPSNVMVTHHDGKPVPKVIDFGIAKATNQKLTEKTLFTRYAHIIGTPAYMSPEQAELSDLDIDTRSDIYSLGVLLYELLTGTTPFSEEELRKASYIEMQRIIREQEPAKPSTKLTTLGDTLTDIAKHRGCTPDLLWKSIRGDLDWIVMKSLEKDRAHRYEGANALAEDIRRHLEHEPVLARGPSTTYRLGKFLRKHRSGVLAAMAAAVVAGVATGVLTLWSRDRLQLAEAKELKDQSILSQAREQYAKADRDGAMETIKPILDHKRVGPEARLLQANILVDNRRSEEAVTVLNDLLNERREIAGTAYSLLARILWESESLDAEKLKQIKEYQRKAEALLPQTAEAYFLRAMAAVTVADQLAALDEALRLEPNHYESRRLRAFTYYASRKYEKMKDDAMVLAVLRPRDPLGYSLHAIAWRELGRYQEAIADYDAALALTLPEDPQNGDLLAQRCAVLLRLGQYERVIAEAQETLRIAPQTVVLLSHLFCALTGQGRYAEASNLYRRIIQSDPAAGISLRDQSMKYVFDTLEAGGGWHPPDRGPRGAGFAPMFEAEAMYRHLRAHNARRLITDCFSPCWSPDGSKVAYALGRPGYCGIAVYDVNSRETNLLIVPGKDPSWSPDGRYIVFVRDCEALRPAEVTTAKHRAPTAAYYRSEEVWVMNADGTQPRRLAVSAGYPSWHRDSQHVYYQSRKDSVLYLISMQDIAASPVPICPCPSQYPSVSPDGNSVGWGDGVSVCLTDLVSQAPIARWSEPAGLVLGNWSCDGREFYLGGYNRVDFPTGLWVYDVDKKKTLKVLSGQIMSGQRTRDRKRLLLRLGSPYYETWVADLDPALSTIEALGPGRTPEEHYQELVNLYTRAIEVDPADASAYSSRAQCYDYLHERLRAQVDMRRWSAVVSARSPSGVWSATSPDLGWIIDLPFDCEVVFSAERPVHTFPTMSIAFGQKGRCEMKRFEIPMVVTSLVGLCFLAGLDAPVAHADFTFGDPVNIQSVFPFLVNGCIDCFSADGLEMYFELPDRAGGQGGGDLWLCKRASPDDDWAPPENLGPTVNSASDDGGASITGDGLELYFCSIRPGGYGGFDIYVTRRATRDSPWDPPTNLGATVNTSSPEFYPTVSSDGLELYFSGYNRSGGYGGFDLYVSKRSTGNDPWGPASNLGPAVNCPAHDATPCLSADGLLLFLASDRAGGYGNFDIWMTRRAGRSAPWQPPVNLGPIVNGPTLEQSVVLAPDGSALYFARADKDTKWKAPILPIVDFNGDGKVDGKEVLALAQHWGQNKSLYDIGSTPVGDGVVDANDLTVLAGYIGQEVNDPTLIAHWALDETEGMTAHDSAGRNDAMVLGGATWQPVGGKIGGAVALDGKDDFVRSGSVVLDPAKGPLSVTAWVKGGAPNKVIVSQSSGADWLHLNSVGMLTTDLKSTDRNAKSLSSDAFVTDDQWHRVVLTWDGTDRTLQMDGVEVARDTQPSLAASSGSLHIGAGKNLTPGAFWSGLIDDVRVYNRVVVP